MADPRFLIVRLGSLGDIVHTLPAAAALRDSFPQARIDWLVDRRWRILLEGNPDINEAIALDRKSWRDVIACVKHLRAAGYTCALDFQGLYKSAILLLFSGATRRIGFRWSYAREGPAALAYTERVSPRGAHKVEHNLALVENVGARTTKPRFPLCIPAEAQTQIRQELSERGVGEFFVLSPGGGWRSKCWPAERFGALHRELALRHGWRGVVSFGPGERELAESVRTASGEPAPILLPMDLAELMALLRRAKFVVAGDTGPLHLACALGTPVIGLYGPTDPARNGPFSTADIVVRNAKPEETTYKRGAAFSPTMLSITVEQVLVAIEKRLGIS